MPPLKLIWDCMFSPKLLKTYGSGPIEKLYEPTSFEKWGDQIISSLYIIWKIGLYTSPFIVGILYHRDYFSVDGLVTLTKFATSIGVILVISYCCRVMGRVYNPTYTNFMVALKEAEKNMTPITKQNIAIYDFEFSFWPVEFDYSDLSRDPSKTHIGPDNAFLHRNLFHNLLNLPFKIAAALAIHTFGIRLIYPGSIGILQMILEKALLQGRTKLVEYYRGERFKIKTYDSNELDVMFVDKRNETSNGNTLVVCCEGNAGFYEIGVMSTPLEGGYSVLGWNHPGFYGSTGIPYPSQEHNAVDAVMQFAIVKLGFKIENIVILAWSIGGYTASWAAMNYPDIKGLVLDATFDDILPLAVTHMPSWLEPVVNIAIRDYVNLNVTEQLSKYPGPLLLIRRTADEVICTRENDITSNRGNYLLKNVLWKRYPFVFDQAQLALLEDYLAVSLSKQDTMIQDNEVNENVCYSLLQSHVSEYSKAYPLKIGEDFKIKDKNRMALYLARKYMIDFKSNHCTNLPSEMFQMPWEVNF